MQALYWGASIYAPASNLKPSLKTSTEIPASNLYLRATVTQAAPDLNCAGMAVTLISFLWHVKLYSRGVRENVMNQRSAYRLFSTSSPLNAPTTIYASSGNSTSNPVIKSTCPETVKTKSIEKVRPIESSSLS